MRRINRIIECGRDGEKGTKNVSEVTELGNQVDSNAEQL